MSISVPGYNQRSRRVSVGCLAWHELLAANGVVEQNLFAEAGHPKRSLVFLSFHDYDCRGLARLWSELGGSQ